MKWERQREIWSTSMRWGELSWLKTTQMHCQRVFDRFLEFIFNSCVFAAHGCMHIWCGFVELFRKNVISLSLLMLLTSHRFSELPGERQWEQEPWEWGEETIKMEKSEEIPQSTKKHFKYYPNLDCSFHSHSCTRKETEACALVLPEQFNQLLPFSRSPCTWKSL